VRTLGFLQVHGVPLGPATFSCDSAGQYRVLHPPIDRTTLAAASSLLVSLTQRSLSQRIPFVTSHDRAGGLPPDLNLGAIADSAATTAIYMPKRTLASFLRKVIGHGLPPHTRAVVVYKATQISTFSLERPPFFPSWLLLRGCGLAIVLIGQLVGALLRNAEVERAAAL